MKNDLLLKQEKLLIRPLTPEDARLLLRWLTDPAVLEWWEGKSAVFTPQRVQEDFYTEEPFLRRCIIEYEDSPIGYLQVYRLTDEERAEYDYPHPELVSFGLDQFIGEPAYWNRKIGRRFLSMMLDRLCLQEGAQSVVLDPHADNLRAIRCYEACGFRRLKLLPAHELHDGTMVDCWLMEYRPA